MLDLGDGEAVAFKVESHNHLSAVEPFQGAATGVGGILRDVVAMGARLVALLDGLYFGERPSVLSAVAGIGGYGNSVGVPTVGGDALRRRGTRTTAFVNAMCVGSLPTERVLRAKARVAGHGRPFRSDHRTRRDRRRVGAGERGARRKTTPTSARACRSAIRSSARS